MKGAQCGSLAFYDRRACAGETLWAFRLRPSCQCRARPRRIRSESPHGLADPPWAASGLLCGRSVDRPRPAGGLPLLVKRPSDAASPACSPSRRELCRPSNAIGRQRCRRRLRALRAREATAAAQWASAARSWTSPCARGSAAARSWSPRTSSHRRHFFAHSSGSSALAVRVWGGVVGDGW